MVKKETGYPHIDKPWMKYYDSSVVDIPDPKTNLVRYLMSRNEGYMGYTAQEYYGKNITFRELYDKSLMAAKIFSNLGVKKGDVIINMVPNIPETSQIWFGATEIGAISDFIDPRPDSMDIIANANKVFEVIKYERAKYIVALDICYLTMLKPIENELKAFGIEDIIILSASDSMNLSGKIDYMKDFLNYNNLKNLRNTDRNVQKLKNYKVLLEKIKMMQKTNSQLDSAIKSSVLRVHKYSDLINECHNLNYEVITDPNLINYIGHTSGTSGSRPKPITATNGGGISTLQQLIKGNVNFNPGERALHVLPFFAPFGAYDNYLLNIVSNASSISVPEFEISEFGYLLKKYKPNIIMATPAWISAFPEWNYLDGLDLSCITKVIYGGDSMTASDEEKVNKWLKKHGSNAECEKGHGMSEFLGCGSYAQKEYNNLNSIGIPLPNTIYTVIDPNVEDRLAPLKFNKNEEFLHGELAVHSDAVTPGTLHGDIIVPHYNMDGKDYIRTKDLVHMNRDGVFFHEARKDRSFTRFDGFKIKPYEIEKEILSNPKVKNACLVDYYDERRKGIMPICHVVLDKSITTEEEILNVINEIVYKNIIGNPTMSSRQIPAKFKIRASIPISKNGKEDFNALRNEELDSTEINVDVSETNLVVDNIEIYYDKKNVKVKKLK